MKALMIAASLLLTTTAFTPMQTQYVYICTTKGSKVYHNTAGCKMLKGCKGEIKRITRQEALTKYGRTPCKACVQ